MLSAGQAFVKNWQARQISIVSIPGSHPIRNRSAGVTIRSWGFGPQHIRNHQPQL